MGGRSREQRKVKEELRSLLYGSGGMAYRILFTIEPSEEADEDGLVRVLHIRQAARKDLTAAQIRAALSS